MKIFFSSIVILAGTSAAVIWGDTVAMKDGTMREGTVVRRTAEEVQLRVDNGGIKATLTLPMAEVDKITTAADGGGTIAGGAAKPAVPGAASTTPANSARGVSATSKPEATAVVGAPKTMPTAQLPARRGFLVELAATIMHQGPDDPARLPEELRKLWETAARREVMGNRGETLESLQLLDDAFAPLPGGPERLDGICRRERAEAFGSWLARVHWDVVAGKYVVGPLDFKEVRDSERRPLIGILKEKTAPALDPLKSYFPPADEKTGKPGAFRPAQLQGITAANAIEVKKQASYASALLLAQIKLEPKMPAVDRVLLSSQLQTVGRILARATDLEPAARMAAEKAARERRIAEEKARRPG